MGKIDSFGMIDELHSRKQVNKLKVGDHTCLDMIVKSIENNIVTLYLENNPNVILTLKLDELKK